MPGSRRAARPALGAVAAAILVATGCATSTGRGVNAGTPSAAEAEPTTGSTTTTTAPPTRRALGIKLGFEPQGRVFTIDGMTGAVPAGWDDPHVRAFYFFLGYNTDKQPPEFNWLSVVGPTWTAIGSPGPVPAFEPTPPDIAAQLAERSVEVTELGTVTVDGVTAPVIQVDGHLFLCDGVVLEYCRANDPAQFYIILPGTDLELVVEGTSDLLAEAGAVTAEQAVPLITALQTWADTIDLP